MDVRILRAGDEAVLGSVADGTFDDPIDTTASAAFLAHSGHRIAVAIEDGVVVGMATGVAVLHPDKPAPELFVNEVGVAPGRQGRKIGKQVLAALLAEAKAMGCREAWVLTDRENPRALRLYSGLGGVEHEMDQVMLTFPLR